MTRSHEAKAGVMPIPRPGKKGPSLQARRRAARDVLSPETKAVVIARWGNLGCTCGCGRPVDPLNPACWHHIFPKQKWPELIDEPDNLVLIAVDCHADHETAAQRLPRKITRHANRLATDPRMTAYLAKTYTG